jgi:predicted HicB family RNase H-like nuclease
MHLYSFRYKGFKGVAAYSDVDKVFFGRVIDIKDVITFQADVKEIIEKEFQESIDDYLEFCKSRNEEPSKPI